MGNKLSALCPLEIYDGEDFESEFEAHRLPFVSLISIRYDKKRVEETE